MSSDATLTAVSSFLQGVNTVLLPTLQARRESKLRRKEREIAFGQQKELGKIQVGQQKELAQFKLGITPPSKQVVLDPQGKTIKTITGEPGQTVGVTKLTAPSVPKVDFKLRSAIDTNFARPSELRVLDPFKNMNSAQLKNVSIAQFERAFDTQQTKDKGVDLKDLAATERGTFTATDRSIQLLEQLATLVQDAEKGPDKIKIGPGQVKFADFPGTERFRAAFGNKNERDFSRLLRQLQAAFLTASTGAQRGFKEIAFLLPAIPTENLKPEDFIADAKSSIQDLVSFRTRAAKQLSSAGFRVPKFESVGILEDVEQPQITPTGTADDILRQEGLLPSE